MLDKWDYSNVSSVCYSDPKCESYKKAAAFLGDEVEDWGCGTAWAKMYFKKYRGIDGSRHSNVDIVADVAEYRSSVNNILMREVLEYNTRWEEVLENVKKSFKKKFCLVVSTPFAKVTHVALQEKAPTRSGGIIPELNFNKKDILDKFPRSEFITKEEIIETNHLYNRDWILYVERR